MDLSVVYNPKFKASEFVIDGLQVPGVTKVPLKMKKDQLSYVLYGVFLALHLYRIAFFFRYDKDTRKALKSMVGDVLFWDSCYFEEYRVIETVMKKGQKKNVFFWNPLTRWSNDEVYLKKNLKNFRKRNYHFYSFDPQDCSTYNLVLLKNVNRKFPVEKIEVKHDFYFVGSSKGRKEILSRLEQTLQQKGFSTLFLIIDNKADYISLSENIVHSAESACLVEIVSPNQTGLTLRATDALFLGKKLITNCKSIEKMDFYNPKNIYVINDEELPGIENFIREPYEKIDDEIVSQYEINRWIKDNFLVD
ncbi:MAG: hypothetical protein J5615_02965 [Fibrobacter sp.]|jgi:hypothetical protein|nr:hypothetical protein [Fibrobacter sp.]